MRLGLAAMILFTAALPTAASGPATAAPRTSSEVRGVALTPLSTLPHAPSSPKLDPYCETYRIKPTTQGGRLAASRGWIVTSEAKLGPYQVVSFAGSFEPATSGVCLAHDANIAIFDGAFLGALAYAGKPAKRTLGTVDPIEPGALLIRGGDGPSVPIGELHAKADGFSITPLAASQPICSGRAAVPNVYGLGIRKARKLLLANGWKPEPPKDKPDEGDFQATAFVKEGLVEAVSCSGTGYNFCTFTYRNDTGGLSVSTLGEDFSVYRYENWCRQPR